MNTCVIMCLTIIGLLVSLPLQGGIIKNCEFEVGGMLNSHHFKGTNAIRLDGTLLGGYGSFTFAGLEPIVLGIRGSYTAGDLTARDNLGWWYPLKDNIRTTLFEINPTIGYTFQANESVAITPYTGFGYRSLVNKVDDILVVGEYRREQDYWYFPLGVDIAFQPQELKQWTVGAKADVKLVIHQARHVTPDVDVSYEGNAGFGLEFAPYLRLDVSGNFGLILRSFVRYWKVTLNDQNGVYVERENATTEFGGSLGAAF